MSPDAIKRLVRSYRDVYGACQYWLELEGEMIVDATASQCRRPNGRAMPLVYVGERPEWYEEPGQHDALTTLFKMS